MDGYAVSQLDNHERRLQRLERLVELLSHGRDRIIVDDPITVHGDDGEIDHVVGVPV